MGPYRLDPQSLRLRANPGSPIGALVGIFDSGTPAHAGMNRLREPLPGRGLWCTRACGDEPGHGGPEPHTFEVHPRMRG